MAVRATAPRLDVSYLVATDINGQLPHIDRADPHSGAERARTIISFPSLATDVREPERPPQAGCHPKKPVISSQTFLVIQNRGARDADGVAVETDRLVLERGVQVHDAPNGSNYLAQLAQGAAIRHSVVLRVANTCARRRRPRAPLVERRIGQPLRPVVRVFACRLRAAKASLS